MQYSNQLNSQKYKSQKEDDLLLFRGNRYSQIIDPNWTLQRQQAYGPIIDELQEIFEEGFEPKIGNLLNRFLCKLFNYAAPHQYQKILLGSVVSSILICLFLILFSSLKIFNFTEFTRIYLLLLIIAMIIIYFPLISFHSLLSYFKSRKDKSKRKLSYIEKIRNGVFYRKRMPLEEELLPNFSEHLIEYKIKNLSLFPEEDLKIIEIFLERQEKLFIKSTQYVNKFLATIVSFAIILIPDIALRTSLLTLFWGFLYSFEYFIQKDSINSRSFVCIQILKEAQIRRSKIINSNKLK